MNTAAMTVEEMRELLRAGRRLRVTIGTGAEDPVVVLSLLRDGVVMCKSVAGWSAGVDEPACYIDSDYLATFLDRGPVPIEVLDATDTGWRGGMQ